MPLPAFVAGAGRSLAAAAQTAVHVMRAIGTGIARAASSASQGAGKAAQVAGQAGATAGQAAGAAGAAGAAAPAGAAGATAAVPGAASTATGSQGANAAATYGRHNYAGVKPPPSPTQWVQDFIQDAVTDWAGNAVSSQGGRRRGGRRRRQGGGGQSLFGGASNPAGGNTTGGGTSPAPAGSSGGTTGGSTRPNALRQFQQFRGIAGRIQGGLSTVADLAMISHTSGGLGGGHSLVSKLVGNAGQSANATVMNPLMGAAGPGTGQAMNAIGINPTKWTSDLVTGLVSATRRLDEFGKGLVEARRPLAELHGGIAASVARLDADRYGRSMRLASMTSGSAGYQTRSQSRLEEATLKTNAAIENLKNRVVGAMENVAAGIVEKISRMQVVSRLLDWLAGPMDDKENHLIEFGKKLASGDFNRREHPPMPLPPEWFDKE